MGNFFRNPKRFLKQKINAFNRKQKDIKVEEIIRNREIRKIKKEILDLNFPHHVEREVYDAIEKFENKYSKAYIKISEIENRLQEKISESERFKTIHYNGEYQEIDAYDDDHDFVKQHYIKDNSMYAIRKINDCLNTIPLIFSFSTSIEKLEDISYIDHFIGGEIPKKDKIGYLLPNLFKYLRMKER